MPKQIPPPDGDDSFLMRLVRALVPDEAKIAAWVNRVKKDNPKAPPERIARLLSNRIVRAYTAQGVALALPGAVPGLGTMLQIGVEATTLSADLALMLRNQVYVAFVVGHCYGRTDVEVLLQDTLICIALWTKAAVLTKRGAIAVATKVGEAAFEKKFSAEILKAINRKAGRTVLTKYGTKRGGIAIGKLIPFGIGAAIGASFNYVTLKTFQKAVLLYFNTHLPPDDGGPVEAESKGNTDACSAHSPPLD